MKTKIFIAALAFGFFACGGGSQSSESESTEVEEATEVMEETIDSVAAEMDTAMTAASDSIEVVIDSATTEAP